MTLMFLLLQLPCSEFNRRNNSKISDYGCTNLKHFFFTPHRATIEEVEGDVCELESKLDKVSTG